MQMLAPSGRKHLPYWSSCIKHFIFRVEACSGGRADKLNPRGGGSSSVLGKTEATLEEAIGCWKSSVYSNDGATLLIAHSNKPTLKNKKQKKKTHAHTHIHAHWRNCPRVLKNRRSDTSQQVRGLSAELDDGLAANLVRRDVRMFVFVSQVERIVLREKNKRIF